MEREIPRPEAMVLTKYLVLALHNGTRPRGGVARNMFSLVCLLTFGTALGAQIQPYVGVLGGIATLSADAGSETTAQGLSLSSYAPANGAAINAFAGLHLNNYFSLQANFIWNENNLRLNSASAGSATSYQEDRRSSQEAGVVDFLFYFRRRTSWVRPYLGTGVGAIHLSSTETRLISLEGSPELPPATFSSTGPVFRSHVGIDLRLRHNLDFRYSFSEFIGQNEISKHLSPPGPRGLKNFQNLFGFILRL
jgi:outer membrane protein W